MSTVKQVREHEVIRCECCNIEESFLLFFNSCLPHISWLTDLLLKLHTLQRYGAFEDEEAISVEGR